MIESLRYSTRAAASAAPRPRSSIRARSTPSSRQLLFATTCDDSHRGDHVPRHGAETPISQSGRAASAAPGPPSAAPAPIFWHQRRIPASSPSSSSTTTSLVAVNQGGKRPGLCCSYLELWHDDIEDFIDLRKETGDDRRRTHNMNTAHWIPDLFMKRLERDCRRRPGRSSAPTKSATSTSSTAKTSRRRYAHYEKLAEEGKI
ncbi:MAG: hypothetical protein QM760_20370 [Nibricoccus sp.]